MLWASAFVAIRHLGDDFSPGALSLGRLLVGALCLGVVALSRGLPATDRGASGSRSSSIGVLWFGVYNVALNEGERRVDAGTAAMLIQVSPVLIALLAAMFLDERFTVYLGARPGARVRRRRADRARRPATERRPRRASAWCSAWSRAVAYSISLILQKPLVARLPAVHVTWLACTVGAIVCLPFAGHLVGETARRARVRRLVGGLPRRLPDRDRVHDVRLRAAAHERRAASA